MSAQENRWLDRETGPVVRPYAVTKGRTMPASGAYVGLLDPLAIAGATAGHALHIDFHSLETRPVRVPDDAAFVIVHSEARTGTSGRSNLVVDTQEEPDGGPHTIVRVRGVVRAGDSVKVETPA